MPRPDLARGQVVQPEGIARGPFDCLVLAAIIGRILVQPSGFPPYLGGGLCHGQGFSEERPDSLAMCCDSLGAIPLGCGVVGFGAGILGGGQGFPDSLDPGPLQRVIQIRLAALRLRRGRDPNIQPGGDVMGDSLCEGDLGGAALCIPIRAKDDLPTHRQGRGLPAR